MINSLRYLIRSLGFALEGIKNTKGASFKIMIVVGASAIIVSILLKIPLTRQLIMLAMIGLVLSLEIVNTALETYIDSLNPGVTPAIKVVKDMLAGAVLTACAFSLVIGGLIFLW